MLIREMKCGMCGRRFEVEVLDRDDPKEKQVRGYPVRCPDCHSNMIEKVRDIRRVTLQAS